MFVYITEVLIKVSNSSATLIRPQESQRHASLIKISGGSAADGGGCCFGKQKHGTSYKKACKQVATIFKKPLSESNEIDHLLNLMLYSKWKLQEQA